MEVREATPEEAARIVDDLWLPLARQMATLNEDYDALAEDIRTELLDHFDDLMADDEAVVFVGVDDGTFVALGSAEIRVRPPVFARETEAFVNEVYVTEAYRREGVATELLERLEQWGRDHDADHMTLSVPAGDDPARALYEEFGLEVVRSRMATSLS
jgi:GNAT superfamily N-acetyltransferase